MRCRLRASWSRLNMWYGARMIYHLPQWTLSPITVEMVIMLAIFRIPSTFAKIWWVQARCLLKCIGKILTGQIRLKNPPKHRHRRNNHRSQSRAVKPVNQTKIIHLHNRMMTWNPAFANSFMPGLIICSTRIWLIWLKMRCKPPHKVVQNQSINRNKPVIRRWWQRPFNMTIVGQAWYFIVQPLIMTNLEPWPSQL